PKAMPAVWAAPVDEDWGEFTPRVFGLETLESAVGTTAGFDAVVAFDGKLVAVGTQRGRATVWIGEWTD
ncbi:MAG: hypothetical protein KJP22_03975, partial [Acidimicrobiia bacterium]|nr:hypothetical protein [Acidimicrobiia bacterium]